jgi:hypothetical protein
MKTAATSRETARALGALCLLASFTWAGRARAEFPASCPGLGDSLVSHSCFHARHGPFRTVTSVPVEDAANAPRIDGVHTQYEVVLSSPTRPTIVTYQVANTARTGAWAFFHSDAVPLVVETLSGVRMVPLHTQQVTTCSALPRVTVYDLGTERVRVVLGPTNVTRAVVVLENVEDFVVENGRDGDGDGYGSPLDKLESFCVPPSGYVQNALDCDDANPSVHPGASEVCDGVDQNCNSVPDDVGLPCTAGVGACGRDGVTRCNAPGVAASCSVMPGPSLAETCDGKDTNCDGVDDLDTPSLCSDAFAPRCIVDKGSVRCGCSGDSDCGTNTSGRVCDLASKRCVEGCVEIAGRNGCPFGLSCSSSDPLAPGRCTRRCAPECSAGAVCQDGTCVSASPSDAGSVGDSGSSPGPQDEAPSDVGGGCTCDATAPSLPSFGASGIVAALVVLILAARRAR